MKAPGPPTLAELLEEKHRGGATDYWMPPPVARGGEAAPGRIGAGDTVIFCCRREEREVQLTAVGPGYALDRNREYLARAKPVYDAPGVGAREPFRGSFQGGRR